MPGPSRAVAVIALVCVAASLVACSGSTKPRTTITHYVDPSTPPSTSSSSSSGSSSSSPASAGSLPPAPTSMNELPGRCNGELPVSLVASTMGQQLPGDTAFVVGTADSSIHRVGYINCRYGLASQNATPTVEIQVSLYGTTAQAAARISPNVSDFEGHGATSKDANIGGVPAKILTGGSGDGYDTATIVLAYGQRTVAVSLSKDVAAGKQSDNLTKLAVLAIKRTQ